MRHDLNHCNGEITPGEMCTRRMFCQRFIAHEDAVKKKLKDMKYLSAFCCVQPQINVSGHVYVKIPYNEFKDTHEPRSATPSKPVRQSTRKRRTGKTQETSD